MTRATAVFVMSLAIVQTGVRTPPTSATDVTSGDIRATIAKAPVDGILNQQIRVVDMGKYNVAVGVLHRSAKPAQQGAIDHAQVTEVYHIIEGSGTFVTGGTIANARQVAADNVITRFSSGRAAAVRRFKAGRAGTSAPATSSSFHPASRTGSATSTRT